MTNLAYAQQYDVSTLEGIGTAVPGILETIFPILVSVGIFIVVWNMFKLIVNAGDPEKRKQAIHGIFWGIIGIFLMYSIWGIIRLLVNTIQFKDNTPITAPTIINTQPQ